MESLMPNEQGLERGVRLFTHLAEAANHGDAVGVSYSEFLAYLHGVGSFRDFAGRAYAPTDTTTVLVVAERVTARAAGRKRVERSGYAIDAGMDTFIWSKYPPFDRPAAAWRGSRLSIPYTRDQWLLVFPHGARRLVTIRELSIPVFRGNSCADVRAHSPATQRAILQPPVASTARRAPLSASEVSDLRRRLVQLIARLDPEGNRPVKDGVAARIARLSFKGVIPREVAAVMRTITEMRNITEYESRTLSPAQNALVEAAWAAIEEWAASRNLDL